MIVARVLLARLPRRALVRQDTEGDPDGHDVFQEFRAEFELEGARKLAARLLRLRLGESKRASSLIGRLHLCTEPALEAIADLLVSTKKKADLLTAIERIIPKKAPPSE